MPPETTAQPWVPVVAVIAALLAPTIATIVGAWLTTKNARRVASAVEEHDTRLKESTASTDKRLETIEGLVNGRLTAAQKKIAELEQRLFDAGLQPPP
jgi:hypothetical protein